MGRGVRSSARLSGGGSGGSGSSGCGGARAAQGRAAAARSSAAAAAARAAAAERRARAAERAREVEDSPQVLREKCRQLARAVRDAKHLVVYTGAGISTAADIPDYRGPHGVWTRLQRGETVGRVEVSHARPTLTHMALSALWARGALKFVVSQNCDGLHVRAGLPRRALAELHGDMFCERCARCGRVLLRAFDTTERTRRHAHATRRLCPACGHELRDSIVHFGERGRAAWPLNWAGALRHAAAADVVLCLGSSLKVLRRYPHLWQMQRAPHARPALYIVNLQWTPKDAAAALKINARCDAVMAAVARRLRLRVPRYAARRDPLLAHAVPLAPAERHTARAPSLPPPDLSDSDDERCYSLGEPSASSASSDSDPDPDDELPLRRLADRLRAPAPPPPSPPDMRNHFKAFQVSMRSCEATILLRAEHAPSELPPPEPPPAPSHSVPSLSYPFASASSTSFVQRPVPTSDLRRFRIQRPLACNGQLVCGSTFAPETKPNILGDLSTVKQEKGETNGYGAWLCSSKLRQLLELKPKDEDVKSEITHTVGAIKIESNGVTRGEFGVDKKCKVQLPIEDWRDSSVLKTEVKVSCKSVVPYSPQVPSVDRRCKVQLPVRNWRDCSELKSEIKGQFRSMVAGRLEATEYRGACKVQLPVAEWSSERGPGQQGQRQQEADECAALAAMFTRRAVLACRASLYPGLHTILAGACAWCARHFAARRCLWYGPPPDAGAPRVYRVVRGRRYLCACCPDSCGAPLTDDAGWYGKGYRKGRRRRKP